jgi:hypothetical protein
VEGEPTLLVLHVHSVQSEYMKVAVEPDRPIRTLHYDDQTRQSIADTVESQLSLGTIPERAAQRSATHW